MIEFTETTLVRALWFVELRTQNFLAVVQRPAGEPWVGLYRIRIYRDAKAFDSDDEKAWYSMRAPDNGDEHADALERAFDEIVEGLPLVMGAHIVRSDKVVVNGNGLRALELLQQLPWVNLKYLEKES